MKVVGGQKRKKYVFILTDAHELNFVTYNLILHRYNWLYIIFVYIYIISI